MSTIHLLNRLLEGIEEKSEERAWEAVSLRYRIPALSVAIVENYEIVDCYNWGNKSILRKEKISSSTRFQAASISKFIFALVVLKQLQILHFDLDQDVTPYMDWLSTCNKEEYPVVTFRQLLSHTAGYNVRSFAGYDRKGRKAATLEQIIRGDKPATNSQIRMDMIPGLQYAYSGGGYAIAHKVIEELSGKPLQYLAKDVLFTPLGMNKSSFEQTLNAKGNLAYGHTWGLQAIKKGWKLYPPLSACGLWSTPTDLAKAAIAVQRSLKEEQGDYLPQHIAKCMLQKQRNSEIGLGAFLYGGGENEGFGHDGWNEGYVAKLFFSRRLGRGVVIMTNSDEGIRIVPQLELAIAKEYGWPVADQKQDTADLGYKHTGNFKSLTGIYQTETQDTIRISLIADSLYIQIEEQKRLEMIPVAGDSFRIKVLGLKIVFEKTSDGVCTGLSLDSARGKVSARKKSCI